MNAANKPAQANVNLTSTQPSKPLSQPIAPTTTQESNTLLKEGKSSAVTINTPFTVIPGLPALNRILARIDRTTQQDLGFTFKASAAKVADGKGKNNLLVNLDFIGFGWMSSTFNVQYSPVSVKVETGEFNHQPHWGCNASVLSSPMGLVHERAGVKGTFSDCNSTRTFSAAPELSYQSSKTFKPLSAATGGYFFGESAKLRIPAAFVPSLERIQAASPGIEEWETIVEHIAPSIPAIQIGKLINQDIEIISGIAATAISASKSAIEAAANLEVGGVNLLTNTINHKPAPQDMDNEPKLSTDKTTAKLTDTSEKNTIRNSIQSPASEKNPAMKNIEPSNEEKASYTVQKNDTLSIIGKKTGCTWVEIFAANKSTLNGNADKIYPGQELLIPETHAALINHPVVKAQILRNMDTQEKNQNTIVNNNAATNQQHSNEIG